MWSITSKVSPLQHSNNRSNFGFLGIKLRKSIVKLDYSIKSLFVHAKFLLKLVYRALILFIYAKSLMTATQHTFIKDGSLSTQMSKKATIIS